MSVNVFDIMLATARIVDTVFEGTATGGSTTTLIDTAQLSTIDDYYNGGSLYFISGPRSDAVSIVSDYVNSTRTWTIPTGAAITTSQKYASAGPRYPHPRLFQAVAQALAEMGEISQADDTLTVADDTEEYALPDGVFNVVGVEVAQAAAEPYNWKPYHYWDEVNGSLIFKPDKEPTETGNTLRLHYNAPHPAPALVGDAVLDAISPARLAWAAAVIAVGARLRLTRADEPNTEKWLKEVAIPTAEQLRRRFPIRNRGRSLTPSGWLR